MTSYLFTQSISSTLTQIYDVILTIIQPYLLLLLFLRAKYRQQQLLGPGGGEMPRWGAEQLPHNNLKFLLFTKKAELSHNKRFELELHHSCYAQNIQFLCLFEFWTIPPHKHYLENGQECAYITPCFDFLNSRRMYLVFH